MRIRKILSIVFLGICLFAFTSCGETGSIDCEKDPNNEACQEQTPAVEKVTVEFKEVTGEVISTVEIEKGTSVTEFPKCTEVGFYYSSVFSLE